MTKLLNYLSVGTIATAFVLFSFFAYILFFPITVIKPNVQPYKVLTPTVRIGHNLVYEVDACKYMYTNGTIYRSFVGDNSINYPMQIATNNVAKGCNITKVSVPIPMYLPVGKYYVKLDIIYQVNSFRSIPYHFTTGTFNVTK